MSFKEELFVSSGVFNIKGLKFAKEADCDGCVQQNWQNQKTPTTQ